MESRPEIKFALKRTDMHTKMKTAGRNLVASDFGYVTLHQAVDDISQVNGLPVTCTSSSLPPSRSRGGDVTPPVFTSDELEEYTICDSRYKLETLDDHNKLCLLRGILQELIPPGSPVLGSPLPAVDGIVNIVIRSLERDGFDSDNDEEPPSDPPPPKRFKKAAHTEGALTVLLTILKEKMEDCTVFRNDVGKMFLYQLVYLVIAVGGGEMKCLVSTSANRTQQTAILAKAFFHDQTSTPEDFLSVADVQVTSFEGKPLFVFEVKEGSEPGEGQLGMHMMLSASGVSPVFGLVVGPMGNETVSGGYGRITSPILLSRLLKAQRRDGQLVVGRYDTFDLTKREELMRFTTSLFYVLYGTQQRS